MGSIRLRLALALATLGLLVGGVPAVHAASCNGASHASSLANGGVSPGSGTTSAAFTFSVTFTDSAGCQPNSMVVVVGGVGTFGLTGSGTNYAGGVTFSRTMTLPPGTFNYSFTATSGSGSGAQTISLTSVSPSPVKVTIPATPAPTPIPTPVPTPVPTVRPTVTAAPTPTGTASASPLPSEAGSVTPSTQPGPTEAGQPTPTATSRPSASPGTGSSGQIGSGSPPVDLGALWPAAYTAVVIGGGLALFLTLVNRPGPGAAPPVGTHSVPEVIEESAPPPPRPSALTTRDAPTPPWLRRRRG